MAEWVRSLNFSSLIKSFDHRTAVTGVGSSPARATCETSQVLLAGVSGGFPGVLPFRTTYRLARLDMSEIILTGTLNLIHKKKNHFGTSLKIGLVYFRVSKHFGGQL